jgi:hypothetical protein
MNNNTNTNNRGNNKNKNNGSFRRSMLETAWNILMIKNRDGSKNQKE